MSSTLEIIVNGQDNASGMLRGIGGALSSFGDSARRVGMDLLPVSAGAALVAGSALKMAANYEQSMDVLQVTTGASADEMKALGQLSIDLGADMLLPATSAKDAADAMLELSKAGLSVKDTMAATRGVLQLSAAAQISNSEAALITANALNMFGLSGDKATLVADLLAAGAYKSSANIQEMADALQMSGNVAATAGLSIGDTTTAIALMADQGIRGSDAGTSLKQMLLSLQAPSQKSAELMAGLGISIYDANGSMLPMPQLIANFGGALGGLTQQQRNAALATIFGSDAVRAANVLLLGGTQAWTDMSTAVNAGGAAAQIAAAQNMGLKGAIDGLRSVVETTLLSAAKPLLETLSGIVRWMGELIGKVAAANPQLVTAGLAFAGVLAVAAPLALGIGVIATTLGALLAPIGLVVVAVGALAAAWTTNFGNIQGIVASVVATVQGILAQLQTFVAEHSTQIMGPLNTAWTTIQALVTTVVNGIWSIVSAIFAQVQTFMASHGEQIKNFMLTAWQAIGDIINTTLAIIQAVVPPILNAIRDFIRTHGAEIQAVFSAAWAAISGSISAVLTVIQGILKAALQIIQGDWAGAWETLKKTGVELWTIISETITTIAQKLGPILDAIWAGIKKAAAAVWEDMLAAAAQTWENIKAAAAQKWENVKAAIKLKINEALAAVLKWLDDTLFKIENFDLKAAATKFFGTTLPGIATKTKEALTDVGTWLKSTWEKINGHDLNGAAQKSFGTVVAGIGVKIGLALTNVGTWLKDVATKVGGYDFKSNTLKSFQTVIVGIATKTSLALTNVGTWLKEISTKIAGFDLKVSALKLFTTAVTGIAEKIVEIKTKVGTMLTDIWTAITSFSLFDAGVALINGMVEGVKSMAGALAAAAMGVVQGAIDAAKNLLGIKSPSTVFAEIGRQVIEGLMLGIDEKQAEAAQKVAEAVAAICQAAVTAADALRNFRPVNNMGVITAQVLEFLLGVETEFQELIDEVNQELADKAKQFAEAVAPVVDLIAKGVELLGTLRGTFTAMSWADIWTALNEVAWAIEVMVTLVGKWSEYVSRDLQMAAQEFAENAGPVVDLVSSGLEVLGTLRGTFTAMSWADIWTALNEVAWAIEVMVTQVGKWSEYVSRDLQMAAKEFAENAGPVVDVIGSGLEVLSTLLTTKITSLPWADIGNTLDGVAWVLADMVDAVATWAQYIRKDLQAAAKAFAENAGPVVDVIGSGLEIVSTLLTTKITSLPWADVGNTLDVIAWVLADMVDAVATWGQYIKNHLQAAAKEFAENAGPVVDLVSSGLELVSILLETKITSLPWAEVGNALDLVAWVLADMVDAVATWAQYIKDDLQAAAKAFAENTGPVIDVIEAGLILIKSLETTTVPDRSAIGAILAEVSNTIVLITTKLAELQKTIVGGTLAEASAFVANVELVLNELTATFATLKKIGELEAPAVGLAWVTNLKTSMTAAIPSLKDVLAQIVKSFQMATADLQMGAYNAGFHFMTSLADGLTAGLTYVEAALAALAELFPHSPAKAGPLQVAPDWAAWMMGGLDDAARMVSSGLSWQMPRSLMANGLGQSGGTTSNNTTVNINGPTIRDEMDIRRLADAVSSVLTNQQSNNRRLGATW